MGNAESSLAPSDGSKDAATGDRPPADDNTKANQHMGEVTSGNKPGKMKDERDKTIETNDLSSANIKGDIATVDSSKAKEFAIVGSLDNGKGINEVVDLWELRNLSISRHGLVGYSLRRRAWPKLLSVHDYIDTGASTSNNNVLSASPEDMAYVRKLCQHGTVWNIMDYWREKGEPAEQQDDHADADQPPLRVSIFLPAHLSPTAYSTGSGSGS